MIQQEKNIATLHNLLDYEASRFSSAEIQLQHVLTEWISKASSIKLKTVLQKYEEHIQHHLQKLEAFIAEEKINALTLTNPVMQAFINETREKMNLCSDPEVTDACLLSCVQVINHFKISAYGTAAAFCSQLDMEKAASFFREAEVNEKQIDDRLTQLARFEINDKAKTPIALP